MNFTYHHTVCLVVSLSVAVVPALYNYIQAKKLEERVSVVETSALPVIKE